MTKPFEVTMISIASRGVLSFDTHGHDARSRDLIADDHVHLGLARERS
jgi:hypothetical protein